MNAAHAEGRVLTNRELQGLADAHEETLSAAFRRRGGEVRLPSGRTESIRGSGDLRGTGRSIDLSRSSTRSRSGQNRSTLGVDERGNLAYQSPSGRRVPANLSDESVLMESASLAADTGGALSRLIRPTQFGALLSGVEATGLGPRSREFLGDVVSRRRATDGPHFSNEGELRDAMRSMDRRIRRKRNRGGVLSDAERLAEVNPREIARILQEYGTFTSLEAAAEVADALIEAGMEISDPDAMGEMVIPARTRSYLRRLFQRQQRNGT